MTPADLRRREAYRLAQRQRTTGDCAAGGVEVRYDEPAKVHIDELVAQRAYVHLERMDQHEWCLIVETAVEKVCLFLGAGRRAHVEAREIWRDPSPKHQSTATRRKKGSK